MTQDEFDQQVKAQWAYVNGYRDGVRLVIYDMDLRGIDMSGLNLSHATFDNCDMRGVRMGYAHLREASIRNTDLTGAVLTGSNLYSATLLNVNLEDAKLDVARLDDAVLKRVKLSRADLRGASLGSTRMDPEAYAQAVALTNILPEGDITGYKLCRPGVVVTLMIPKEAKRSNATGRKCRAEYAHVVAISRDTGGPVFSYHDALTLYRVGDTVRCDSWDPRRFVECTGGIHFFLTYQEAVNYQSN